jgi:hypothetical protein
MQPLKYLLPCATTYNCKAGFSALVNLNTRKRSRLNMESDLRLQPFKLEPDISSLILLQK